ncbi:hypothetical protein DFH29DRAFT_1023662 [Suillus ampliporus]|nr:hypothetical protein DFH29DRAFT_1023662 [Suillus ampliporus]
MSYGDNEMRRRSSHHRGSGDCRDCRSISPLSTTMRPKTYISYVNDINGLYTYLRVGYIYLSFGEFRGTEIARPSQKDKSNEKPPYLGQGNTNSSRHSASLLAIDATRDNRPHMPSKNAKRKAWSHILEKACECKKQKLTTVLQTAYSNNYFWSITFGNAVPLEFPEIAPAGSVSCWCFDLDVPGSAIATVILLGEIVLHLDDLQPIIQDMEEAFSKGARSMSIDVIINGQSISQVYHFTKIVYACRLNKYIMTVLLISQHLEVQTMGFIVWDHNHFAVYFYNKSARLLHNDSMGLEPVLDVLDIFSWFLTGLNDYPSPGYIQKGALALQSARSGSCGVVAHNFAELLVNNSISILG